MGMLAERKRKEGKQNKYSKKGMGWGDGLLYEIEAAEKKENEERVWEEIRMMPIGLKQ